MIIILDVLAFYIRIVVGYHTALLSEILNNDFRPDMSSFQTFYRPDTEDPTQFQSHPIRRMFSFSICLEDQCCWSVT